MAATKKGNKGSIMKRQWTLVNILGATGIGKSVTELIQELKEHDIAVKRRTVERDIKVLRETFDDPFAPSEDETYRWDRDRTVTIPTPSKSQALSLTIVMDALKSVLPPSLSAALSPYVEQAKRQLRDPRDRIAAPETQNHVPWWDKICTVSPNLPLLSSKFDEKALSVILEALLDDKQIEVDGSPAQKGKKSPRVRLNPLGLIQHGPVSYLVATANVHRTIRMYKVHELTDVSLSTLSCHRPADFSLKAYVNSAAFPIGTRGSISVSARISDELAAVLRDTTLSDDQCVTDDGAGLLLTATLPDSRQLRSWVLGQGANMEILEPMHLRQEMREQIKQMTVRYGLCEASEWE